MTALARQTARGFTLLEVLVALVIVAFGMGAVLAALSASAVNVTALRQKTMAQWVALNQIADVRLNLQPPQTGTTEGDVKNFANADWHWQQIVTAVQAIPGLMQITVKVRRNSGSSSGGGSTTSGSTSSSSSNGPDWITTVIGFRGDALAAASGEETWGSVTGGAVVGGSSSSSGGASSGGLVPNPGSSTSPGSSTPNTQTTPNTPANPLFPNSSGNP